MKFATSKEHRDFFQKHGWIEFEGLLTDQQLSFINQAIDQALSEGLNVSPEKLFAISSENKFLQGRDLWRLNAYLQKMTTLPRFAKIASELVEKKPLRLGYSQFFPSTSLTSIRKENSSVYSHFLQNSTSLEAVSCLKGILCGMMICLGESQTNVIPEEKDSEGINIFSQSKGSAIFFQSQRNIDWNQLNELIDQRYYLIVYTGASAYYLHQPQDPHTHALKRLGYIVHDKLNDKLNPVVYR